MGLLWMTHDVQQSLSSHHLICEQHPEGLHSSAPSSLLLVATPAARPLHVHRRSGWSHLRLGRCPRMISAGTHTLWSRILVPRADEIHPTFFSSSVHCRGTQAAAVPQVLPSSGAGATVPYRLTKTLLCSPNQRLSRSRRHYQRPETQGLQQTMLSSIQSMHGCAVEGHYECRLQLQRLADCMGYWGRRGRFRCLSVFFVERRQSTR